MLLHQEAVRYLHCMDVYHKALSFFLQMQTRNYGRSMQFRESVWTDVLRHLRIFCSKAMYVHVYYVFQCRALQPF